MFDDAGITLYHTAPRWARPSIEAHGLLPSDVGANWGYYNQPSGVYLNRGYPRWSADDDWAINIPSMFEAALLHDQILGNKFGGLDHAYVVWPGWIPPEWITFLAPRNREPMPPTVPPVFAPRGPAHVEVQGRVLAMFEEIKATHAREEEIAQQAWAAELWARDTLVDEGEPRVITQADVEDLKIKLAKAQETTFINGDGVTYV